MLEGLRMKRAAWWSLPSGEHWGGGKVGSNRWDKQKEEMLTCWDSPHVWFFEKMFSFNWREAEHLYLWLLDCIKLSAQALKIPPMPLWNLWPLIVHISLAPLEAPSMTPPRSHWVWLEWVLGSTRNLSSGNNSRPSKAGHPSMEGHLETLRGESWHTSDSFHGHTCKEQRRQ